MTTYHVEDGSSGMPDVEMELAEAWATLQAVPSYAERYVSKCEECGADLWDSIDGWRCQACFNKHHRPAITEVISVRFKEEDR